jgi:hypothetical protein
LRLESPPALIAQAEAFRRDRSMVLPASSTLRRVVGEQRAQARHLVSPRLLALMPSTLPPCRDALLQVEASHASSLPALKAPPGVPSARALVRLTDKLEQIHGTGVLALALSWLKNNLQTTLARQVSQASANRLRGLFAPQRDTLLVGFLRHTYRDTLDQLVDMDTKLVTATYRRAQHALDTGAKRHRTLLRAALQSFQTIGQTFLHEPVPADTGRTTVFAAIARKVKKLACLAVAAFRAPLLPVYLLAILPLEASSSSFVASNHFGGSTEIGKNVPLALL